MLGTQSSDLDVLCPFLKKGDRTSKRERVSGAIQDGLGQDQKPISVFKSSGIGTATLQEGLVGCWVF